MTVHHQDPWLTVHVGDCRAVLATMEPESVHTVVTSPPYWGLRDYGHGDQLGLEPTPEQYVENMVAVFREVRRVLRSDGTLWLNLGDNYASQGGPIKEGGGINDILGGKPEWQDYNRSRKAPTGVKVKDLVGIPWRVAFALQADGWFLRSDIIWHKPNPMPESAKDRPTKSHEYFFLLTKSPRYFYDAEAVKEEAAGYSRKGGTKTSTAGGNTTNGVGSKSLHQMAVGGRNRRSVWKVATQAYKGAHFATFPPALVEPCVLAGTSTMGCCPNCRTPWKRVTKVTKYTPEIVEAGVRAVDASRADKTRKLSGAAYNAQHRVETVGWKPNCVCSPIRPPVPCLVLDPFSGTATVGAVSLKHGRRYVGLDLNRDYIALAEQRLSEVQVALFTETA